MSRVENGRIQDNDIDTKRFGEVLPFRANRGIVSAKSVDAFDDQNIALTQNAGAQSQIIGSLKAPTTLLVHIDVAFLNAVLKKIQNLSILILIGCRHAGISKFLVAHRLLPAPEHAHYTTEICKIIGSQPCRFCLL